MTTSCRTYTKLALLNSIISSGTAGYLVRQESFEISHGHYQWPTEPECLLGSGRWRSLSDMRQLVIDAEPQCDAQPWEMTCHLNRVSRNLASMLTC
jgi:hypothetical protein